MHELNLISVKENLEMLSPRNIVSGDFSFRGVQYNISLKKSNDQLMVTVEDRMLGDRWKASFSLEYIEDLTKKTGNFKQFQVFASMLESALKKCSDSVSLDLLTYADLQDLRSRKSGGVKTKAASKQQENKKYLVLIYTVEFDRIHYPLPLPYLGKPDVAHLQNMVHQLSQELSVLRSETPSQQHNPASTTAMDRLKQNYKELVQEKKDLLASYNLLVKESKSSSSQGSKDVRLLKKVIQNLEMEILKQKNKFQRQLSKKTSECKRLEAEVKELSAKERSLHLRVKSLTNELNMYKRSQTPRQSYQVGRTSRISVNYPSVDRRSNSRTSVRGNGVTRKSSPAVSYRSSSSRASSAAGSVNSARGSYSGDYNSRRPFSSSGSRFQNFTGSRSRERQKSRTPTPNRNFRRFNPTAYNEEKKKKLRESQERRRRNASSRFLNNSNESRGRSRYRNNNKGGPPPLPPHNRRHNNNSSVESCRNSSLDGGSRQSSLTRRHTSSKRLSTPKWNRENEPSDTSVDFTGGRKLTSSSPKPNHRRKRVGRNDTDIEEIDARLNALQQYMREIEGR